MRPNWYRVWVNAGVALFVFLGALAFYVYTGPSDVAWGEGAHYQRRVALAEVGEGPWDRPLFVMLSQLFLLLPWESLIRRTNLASATFAAGACFFCYLILKTLLAVAPQFIARRVGIVSASCLAVAHTFWFRTVTPGPETLDALLLAATIYFLLRFSNEGRVRHFYIAMAILGLSLSNNLMMLFLLPVFAIFARVVQPPLVRDIGLVRARGLAVLLVSSGVALAVTAWGWVAAGFEISNERWAWVTFWESKMMLSWEAPLKMSLMRFGAAFLYSFPPWTAFMGLLGLVELFRRQKYVFGLIVPLFLVYSGLAVTLRLEEPMDAYVPAWVLVAIAVGYGWWKVLSDGGWRDFALALALSLSPLAIYRYAPVAVEKLGEEPRVMTFLGVPFEAPFDPMVHRLNPDRRVTPSARAFAEESLAAVPDRARLVAASHVGELILAPLRYVVEVEKKESDVRFGVVGSGETLENWAEDPDRPLLLTGLHPPHAAVQRLLDRYHFVPNGAFFRVAPKEAVPGRRLEDRGEPTLLAGEWYGYVEPQGYAVIFSIREAPDASFSGRAVLNPGGSSQAEGEFTRISPIADSLVARVTYDDRINVHIEGELTGNRLEGTWYVYEAQHLKGTFKVWKQP